MTPRLEEKVKQSQGQVKLMNINIDKFGQIANIFQVKAVPTVFLVYKGKLIDGFTG
jgi:thioredoxin-like negative regulator of GroEL